MNELKGWSQQELVECAKACKERAEKDVAFRELLSKDPVKAIKEVTGKDFPVDSLKNFSVDGFKELSDADLEATVGGGFWGWLFGWMKDEKHEEH